MKVCELPREKATKKHTSANQILSVRQKKFVLSSLQEQDQAFLSQQNLQFAAFRQNLQKEAQGTKLGTGGVVLIKADGACCFHLLGAVGQLCANSRALENGQTSCTYPELDVTRKYLLANFSKWRGKERERCESELSSDFCCPNSRSV